MDAREALTCSDQALQDHMAGLTEPDLIAFLADMDRLETQRRAKPVKLGASALYYLSAYDFPVFPLVERTKRPLTPNGFLDASRDPEQVRAWWARWPNANIGTPTGRREQGGCGYDVIDVDGPDGFASIADLRHAHCPPGCCDLEVCHATGALPEIIARCTTPGDRTRERPRPPGAHYYTPAAGTSCTTRALPGIDLRGDGGYVVLPPSIGPDGGRYEWTVYPPKVAA